MRLLAVEQGSPEWIAARLGIPTSSEFHRILKQRPNKDGKYERSAAQTGYLHELVAEWLLGVPLDEDGQGFMAYGRENEPAARAGYEFAHDLEIGKGGFCVTDDGLYGASPDGFVGDTGLVEFKCPSAKVHVGYLLGEPLAHPGQTQGQLLVTGREWVDLVSFHPKLPPVEIRVTRDEPYIEALTVELRRFCMRLEDAKDRLRARGHGPPEDGAGGWLRRQLEASLAGAR